MREYQQFNKNLLNWYPFEKNQSILIIGKDIDYLASFLSQKCSSVVAVKKDGVISDSSIEIVNSIPTNKKFDYILLIDVIPYVEGICGKPCKFEELLKTLEKNLINGGKFLIAMDNKFGLRYFVGNPENAMNKKFASILGYNNEERRIESYTKKSIENLLSKLGYNSNFYYPLPDFRMPNVIFSDEYLPNYKNIDKYEPYTLENSDILMNEIDVYREMLKTNEEAFVFFANSFFIEASKKKEKIKYKYISFNNFRKEEYRLITKIANEYVEKDVVSEEAEKHYEQIKNNIYLLKSDNKKTIDYIDNEKIKSKYYDNNLLLDEVLVKCLEQGDTDKFYELIDGYLKVISENSYKIDDYENTVFGKYDVQTENKEIAMELKYLKNGFWDMTFKNCFLIEDEYCFFDQEWIEENLPVEYILYRSILYTISLRRFFNIEELFSKYGIDKYKKIFEELDNILQKKIIDENTTNFFWNNKKFDIDLTKQEMKNMLIRDEAKEKAIMNFQEEIKKCNEIIEKMTIENKQKDELIKRLYEELGKSFRYKIKKRIKRIIGGNHEK